MNVKLKSKIKRWLKDHTENDGSDGVFSSFSEMCDEASEIFEEVLKAEQQMRKKRAPKHDRP